MSGCPARGIAAAVLTNPRAATMVAATVDMTHGLGLAVTAEGVETLEVRDHLLGAGCNLAQGRLHGRAVPAAEVGDLVRRLGAAADRTPRHDDPPAGDRSRVMRSDPAGRPGARRPAPPVSTAP